MLNFWLLTVILPNLQGFPKRFRGIILGDNTAGHCFVLRGLFPMSFFKLVMIVSLKIYATNKIFGKIYLKAIRDTLFFFQYVVCNQGREGILGGEGWGDIQQMGKV